MKTEQKRNDGISLRAVNICLIIGAVVISGLMIFSTFHLSTSFHNLTNASEQQIELRNAARELTDASDYLTEKVQRFSVLGDIRFLEEYFAEAFEANHREEAIETMSERSGNTVALEHLQNAMDGSVKLMDREYMEPTRPTPRTSSRKPTRQCTSRSTAARTHTPSTPTKT